MGDRQEPKAPEVTVADLITMIGELHVNAARQGRVINQQAARIAELEASESGPVAIAAGGARD